MFKMREQYNSTHNIYIKCADADTAGFEKNGFRTLFFASSTIVKKRFGVKVKIKKAAYLIKKNRIIL